MNNKLQKKFYHFSVDDVFASLIEISDKKINVFDHPFFAFLKELHDEFGTNVDLYLFYQSEIDGKLRTLQEVSSGLKKAFEQNPWIRFGPHALDYATRPYNQSSDEQKETFSKIFFEINRFTGKKNRSVWVRLHYFSESFELAKFFKEHGVEVLFTTDKPVASWRIDGLRKSELLETGLTEYKGMKFARTHFRLEYFSTKGVSLDEQVNAHIKREYVARSHDQIEDELEKFLQSTSSVFFFGHEISFTFRPIKENTKEIIRHLNRKGVASL